MTQTTWTDRIPDTAQGLKIASVTGKDGTRYALVPETMDYDDVALEYAESAAQLPVRLQVRPDWTGEFLVYEIAADRSVEVVLHEARTGGDAWQRP